MSYLKQMTYRLQKTYRHTDSKSLKYVKTSYKLICTGPEMIPKMDPQCMILRGKFRFMVWHPSEDTKLHYTNILTKAIYIYI